MPGKLSLLMSLGVHVIAWVLMWPPVVPSALTAELETDAVEAVAILAPTVIIKAAEEPIESSPPDDEITTVEAKRIDYAGSSPESNVDETTDTADADASQESLTTYAETAISENESEGQISDSLDTDGLQAPSLTLQGLTPAVIDCLLERGQARLVAIVDTKLQFQLDGTLTRPTSFHKVNEADLNQLSQRSVTLQNNMTTICRTRLASDWGLSRSSLSNATIGIWFTHAYDNYLLSVQLKSVAHLPQTERAKQKTTVILQETPTGIRAVAMSSATPNVKNSVTIT